MGQSTRNQSRFILLCLWYIFIATKDIFYVIFTFYKKGDNIWIIITKKCISVKTINTTVMAYVIEGLYLGDIDDAYKTTDLRERKGITHILSVDRYSWIIVFSSYSCAKPLMWAVTRFTASDYIGRRFYNCIGHRVWVRVKVRVTVGTPITNLRYC